MNQALFKERVTRPFVVIVIAAVAVFALICAVVVFVAAAASADYSSFQCCVARPSSGSFLKPVTFEIRVESAAWGVERSERESL